MYMIHLKSSVHLLMFPLFPGLRSSGGNLMVEEKKVANLSMKLWLEAIQAVIGINELESVLSYAHLEKYIGNFPPGDHEMRIPLEDLRNLLLSLYEVAGGRDTHDLQLHIGRERARISVRTQPELAGIVHTAACSVPERKRMRMALEKIKDETERMYKTHIELREEDSSFLCINRSNFESEEVISTIPVCGAFAGILQYTIEQVTENLYHVEEVECRALGHRADVFKIKRVKE
jgi:predicted hydrocarbon binding protein